MIAQPIAVLGRVREQGLARSDRAQHVVGRAAVMGLSSGQLQGDGQTVRIRDSMDLRRQAASRAPHADGSKVSHTGGTGIRFAPLFTLAPCWWTRMDELSTDCSDPS